MAEEFTEREAGIWLAAAIEADGCITIQNVAKGNFFRPLIHLCGARREYMEFAKRIAGNVGSISKQKYNGEDRQPIYTWSISHRAALKVARMIRLFCVIKSGQCDAVIELASSMCYGRAKRDVRKQTDLWEICRLLNGFKHKYTGTRTKHRPNSPEPLPIHAMYL